MKPYYSYNPENGRPRILDANGKLLDEAGSYTGPAVYNTPDAIYAAFSDYWQGVLPTECVVRLEIVGGEFMT